MDLKTRIQYKIQELQKTHKFLLDNPRYVKFINDLFLLVGNNGRLPLPVYISQKLRIKLSKVYYMIETLQKHMAWPFLGMRSKYSRSSYQPEVQFSSLDMSNVKHEPMPHVDEVIDESISVRIEAARKAKHEKHGAMIKNKDIDAYLTK